MMKLFLATLALLVTGGVSYAQGQPAGTGARAAILQGVTSVSDDPLPSITHFAESQVAEQFLASDFIGLGIYSPDGGQLGTIDDVLFDESGKLAMIVLDVTEVVGARKRVTFNISDLRRDDQGDQRLVAALDRTSLEKAPDFTSLSEEMRLNDGQSLTVDQTSGSEQTPSGMVQP